MGILLLGIGGIRCDQCSIAQPLGELRCLSAGHYCSEISPVFTTVVEGIHLELVPSFARSL